MGIAVIGAGAIGSVVAGYLTKAGQEVILIGRGDHINAIKTNGLKIKGVRGEETFQVQAAAQLDRDCEAVIFTTKTQDLDEACRQNRGWLKNCLVLSSQNGVQADAILSKYFAKEKIISSIVMFGATYVSPGEAVLNFEGDWIIGKPYGPIDGKTCELIQALKSAFSVVVTDNIVGMKWTKLFVNFNNCIPALIGKSMQETFADMDFCRLSIKLLKEGVAIIQKAGIQLIAMPAFPTERIFGLACMPQEQAAGIIHKTLTGLSKEPLYGSILQSIMRGRPSEIDFINGEVVRLAGEKQMAAPLNQRIVDLVHQVENRRKYFRPQEIKELFDLAQREVNPSTIPALSEGGLLRVDSEGRPSPRPQGRGLGDIE